MLRSLEEICRDVVGHLPDIVYRLDGEGNIVFISEAIRKYGYDPIALVGNSIFDLVHPQGRTRVQDHRGPALIRLTRGDDSLPPSASAAYQPSAIA